MIVYIWILDFKLNIIISIIIDWIAIIHLNPISVIIFNAKIYSLCQNSNISKKKLVQF